MMPVEKLTRYTTQVETLQEAWSFVMLWVDQFETPAIEIKPFLVQNYSEMEEAGVEPRWVRMFGVSVSGSETIEGDTHACAEAAILEQVFEEPE